MARVATVVGTLIGVALTIAFWFAVGYWCCYRRRRLVVVAVATAPTVVQSTSTTVSNNIVVSPIIQLNTPQPPPMPGAPLQAYTQSPICPPPPPGSAEMRYAAPAPAFAQPVQGYPVGQTYGYPPTHPTYQAKPSDV